MSSDLRPISTDTHSTCRPITTNTTVTTNIVTNETTTATSNITLKAEVTNTVVDKYYMMLWWRHFCKTNELNWIATSDERQLGKDARRRGISTPTHGYLQRIFLKYGDDSSSSDSDEDTIDAHPLHASDNDHLFIVQPPFTSLFPLSANLTLSRKRKHDSSSFDI